MRTELLQTSEPDLDRAAEILRAGGLVAFPTETVYGLGADALNAVAVEKIFAAKERPRWDPLIVHLASLEMLAKVARTTSAVVIAKLAAEFMPGPLTLVLPKLPIVPDAVTAGLSTVAVRVPNHPIALELIARAGMPIAAPSGNRFSHVSPTTAQHVLADLDGRIEAVLDAGPTPLGIESTVLDLSGAPTVLRQGGVTQEQIEAVIGKVAVAAGKRKGAVATPSPGMAERHYAPRTRVLLVESEDALRQEVTRHPSVGVLLPSDWSAGAGAGATFDWGRWRDWPTLAARLYAGLRWLDEQNVDVIIAPLPRTEGLGAAIRDRLIRAAQ